MFGANIKKDFEKGISDFGSGSKQSRRTSMPQLKRCPGNEKDYFWVDGNGVCEKAKTCPHLFRMRDIKCSYYII